MHIQAAVAREGSSALTLEHLAAVEPGAGEIRVRLVACGVAPVDRDAVASRLAVPTPFVPGGEGAGVVEHVGAGVEGIEAGDAVVILAAFCGQCDACRRGLTRACHAFGRLNLTCVRSLDGGAGRLAEDSDVNGFFFGQSAFATHAICGAAQAVKVSSSAPLELMAAVCGALSGAAAAVLQAMEVREDSSLVVVGDDVAGLFACMVAKAHGVSLIIHADPDDDRRQRATALGATIVTDDIAGLETFVKGLTPNGANHVVFATSDASALAPALAALAPEGRCILADLPPAPRLPASGDPRIGGAEDHLRARDLIATLIAMQEDGRLPIEHLATFFPFDQVNEALATLSRDPHVKPVIRFSIGAFDDLDRAETEQAASEAPAPADDGETDREPERVTTPA